MPSSIHSTNTMLPSNSSVTTEPPVTGADIIPDTQKPSVTESSLISGDISADTQETLSSVHDTDSISSETDVPVPQDDPELSVYDLNALEWNKNSHYFVRFKEMISNRSKPLTWLFCGDSITANDRNYSGGYRNYSEIIEAYLVNDLDRKNDYIVNTAVSGYWVANIQYNRDIQPFSPDIVYIMVGTNNPFSTEKETADYKTDLTNLFRKVVDSGAIPIVAISCPFHPEWSNKAQIVEFETVYTKTVIEVAKEFDLLIVNYFVPFAERSPESFELWQCGDKLHPSRLGYLKFAQILITDLGMDVQDSVILSTSCDAPLTGEILDEVSLPELSEYCSAVGSAEAVSVGRTIRLRQFVLFGGPVANGNSTACLTRRSLPQLLKNNNANGAQRSYFGSFSYLTEILKNFNNNNTAILLMPEAFGLDGTPLTDGTINELVDAAIATGNQVVVLTPPFNPTDQNVNEGNRRIAETLRSEARSRGLILIDIFAYTESISIWPWFDEAGYPDVNGCNAIAKLIIQCLA